ncbi:MAG TPA: four helix bundle protein [Tepidisphaeraceae bacterium]|nr:four helix bundle protein [Tepidisphaeraceae bacterium]
MKTTKRGFENLHVYRLSERLADDVWAVVNAWKPLAGDTVGKQLIRAVDSIGANLAEGSGRGTYKDNHRFIDMARGSLYETRHWLRRAYRRKLLPREQVALLRECLAELGPRLNAYRNAIRKLMTAAKQQTRPSPK